MNLPDGVPCEHPGCLSHLSHPCEGCGRVGGRTPDGYDVKLWESPNGKEYFIGIDVGIGSDYAVSVPIPKEWPWKALGEGPTLAQLQAMLAAMPKFPKYPPYYRCGQETFDLMRSYMVEGEPSLLKTVIGGCTIVIDNGVPEGEFLPPEGWEENG